MQTVIITPYANTLILCMVAVWDGFGKHLVSDSIIIYLKFDDL